MSKRKSILTIIILFAVITAAYFFISSRNSEKKIEFETVKVVRGDISNTVTATGTIQAIMTVQVGTQVSGVIREIYVDYNSRVKKGQLLAKIDETPLQAALEQSRAAVDAAEADLRFKEEAYERSKKLFEKEMISKAEWEQAVFNYNTARANLTSAQATHSRNKANLDYASILSPIDGVVLSRSVEKGQTVAASFNTPTLFTIANDLTRMRVEANVDEADIGQIKVGQRVEFTVDAYPEIIFEGKVTQIRLQPVVTNNVVTYTIIIEAPNPDQKLMPGMTASANIFIQEKNDVLILNNRALRFNPDEKILPMLTKTKVNANNNSERENYIKNKGISEEKIPSTIWVKKGADFVEMNIKIGMSDGINTEVISGISEGDEVLVSAGGSENDSKPRNSENRSPFMPGRRPPRR